MFWRIPTGQPLTEFLPENAPENRLHQDDLKVRNQPYYVCSITNDELPHVSELFEFEADTFGEPERYDALDEALQLPDLSDAEPVPPGPEIGESKELQEALKALLNDYIHLLQAEVSKTPAKIPPMKLKVNDNQWGFAKQIRKGIVYRVR